MSSTRSATVALFVALIVLGLGWELSWAPLRPGGSMLVLKVLPLAMALPSLWTDRIRTYQWWSMAILAYVAEGALRAGSDRGLGVTLGWIEAVLAGLAFAAILMHVRVRRQAALAANAAAAAAAARLPATADGTKAASPVDRPA